MGNDFFFKFFNKTLLSLFVIALLVRHLATCFFNAYGYIGIMVLCNDVIYYLVTINVHSADK